MNDQKIEMDLNEVYTGDPIIGSMEIRVTVKFKNNQIYRIWFEKESDSVLYQKTISDIFQNYISDIVFEYYHEVKII